MNHIVRLSAVLALILAILLALVAAVLIDSKPAAAAEAATFNEQWANIMDDLYMMELHFNPALAMPRIGKTDRIKPKTDDGKDQHEPPVVPAVPLVRRKVAAKADACSRVGKRKVMVSKFRWRCREA